MVETIHLGEKPPWQEPSLCGAEGAMGQITYLTIRENGNIHLWQEHLVGQFCPECWKRFRGLVLSEMNRRLIAEGPDHISEERFSIW